MRLEGANKQEHVAKDLILHTFDGYDTGTMTKEEGDELMRIFNTEQAILYTSSDE